MNDAKQLTAAIGGRWHGSYGTARCPAHEDRSPSLSIQDGDTAIVVKCHAGCESQVVVDALRRLGVWQGREDFDDAPELQRKPTALSKAKTDDVNRRREMALSIWRASINGAGTNVERYLRARGIESMPPTLRCHVGLKHTDTGLTFPAMIAAVQGADRRIIAIHRTYLQAGGAGKANVSRAKMALGSLDDGAVRLAAAGSVLGLAEGVESALSAMALFNVPVWAALSTERLARVWVPDVAERVIIFADNDPPGLAGANKALESLTARRRRVEIKLPSFGDWNDQLLQREKTA